MTTRPTDDDLTPQVSIVAKEGEPTRCEVRIGGVLVFSGADHSPTLPHSTKRPMMDNEPFVYDQRTYSTDAHIKVSPYTAEQIADEDSLGSSPITDDDLAQWKQAEEKATEGPWEYGTEGRFGYFYIQGVSPRVHIRRENIAFIATSRAAFPALIAEVEAVRAENAEMSARIEKAYSELVSPKVTRLPSTGQPVIDVGYIWEALA